MASIILNTLFYPDIVNIILDYIMIDKSSVIRIKDVSMYHLEILASHIKYLFASKHPRRMIINKIKNNITYLKLT
jgi:hypothetical protein